MIAFKRRVAIDDPVGVFGDSTQFVKASAAENRERTKRFMVSMSFASDLRDQGAYPFHFMPGPAYTDSVAMLLRYISEHRKKGAAPPRVAFIHAASEFGRDPIPFGTDYARKLGLTVVSVIQMKTRELDVTLDVIKLREAQPDYAIIHGFGGSPVSVEIMRLARDYGLKTQFMGTFWESSRLLMLAAGAVGDGFIGVTNYTFDTSKADPETQPMLAAIDRIRRKADPAYDGFPSVYYFQAWTSMMIFAKAAEMAIDNGRPLTGPNLAAEMRRLKNWDTGGVIGAPVTFRDQRIPIGRIVRFDGRHGMYPQPLTSWITLDKDP
jgi:branched-chain amino acid transport system substrate-binding protein